MAFMASGMWPLFGRLGRAFVPIAVGVMIMVLRQQWHRAKGQRRRASQIGKGFHWKIPEQLKKRR